MAVVFSKLQVALAAGTVASIAYYHKKLKNANRSSFEWKYFDYHPALMMVAFILLGGSGQLAEKLGIKNKHNIHKNFQIATVATALYGAYVVWNMKEKMNRAAEEPKDRIHILSWHARLGALALALYSAQGAAGYFLSNPSRDIEKYMQWKDLHRSAGKLIHLVALSATFSGWFKMAQRHDQYSPADYAGLGGIALMMLALGTQKGDEIIKAIG